MIARISGTIIENNGKSVVLEVGGIGYRVFCIPRDLTSLTEGEHTFYTYQHVRENALELYGFVAQEEERMFEILISISGIGPRGALGILSAAPVDVLQRSIVAEDSSILTRISGIGKKTAEKIILELKDKFGAQWGILEGNVAEEGEVVEALMSLGYSREEVLGILKAIPKEATTTEEKMKEALKIIGKK